jgi:hypothetical protein
VAARVTRIGLGVIVGTLVLVGMGLAAAGASASPLLGAPLSHTASAQATSASYGTFNFTAPGHPVWNSGNLCTLNQTGKNVSCVYSGPTGHHSYGGVNGCGCQSSGSLVENFSGAHETITIKISNLQKNLNSVYLNFKGKYDTIYLDLSGCQGGTVNITMISQYTTLYLNYTASNVQTNVYFYSDLNAYNAVISGNWDHTTTYFVSAIERLNECPAGNESRSDTYGLTMTGWGDSQKLIYVNAMGYTTSANSVWGSHWNVVSYENTTSFACGWSLPPASTCHHGGWAPEAIAASRPL